MRWCLFPAIILLMGTVAISAATYAPGYIVYRPDHAEGPFEIRRRALPGGTYDIEATDALGQS